MSSPLVPGSWSKFPDDFRERLGNSVGRQRTMAADSQLLIVAHEVPEPDEAMRRGVLFWRDGSGTWRCSNGEPGIDSMSKHLDRYAKRIEELDEQENRAQQADDYPPLLDGLAPIVRSVRHLLDAFEEARKLMPHVRELIDVRDRSYDLCRQAELLYEDTKNSMEVAIVRRADEQTRVAHQMMVASHRLNMLVSLFFPIATLGSILGTTLTDGWSWSHSPIPFAAFLVTGALSGVIMANYIGRKHV